MVRALALALLFRDVHRVTRADRFMEDELVLITPPNFESDQLPRSEFVGALLMRQRGFGSHRVVEKTVEKASFRLKSFKKVIDLDSHDGTSR